MLPKAVAKATVKELKKEVRRGSAIGRNAE
jgi:hypothetical protein